MVDSNTYIAGQATRVGKQCCKKEHAMIDAMGRVFEGAPATRTTTLLALQPQYAVTANTMHAPIGTLATCWPNMPAGATAKHTVREDSLVNWIQKYQPHSVRTTAPQGLSEVCTLHGGRHIQKNKDKPAR